MKRKTKNIFKKVSLAICGLGILGAVAVGATQLVNYMKNDIRSINLSYEIGGLNAQGRYEEDDSTIYTKNKFACEGLQAELEFDSSINYEIFYYDILDNFISSTGVITEGYSTNAPLNGAYARIEITPIGDEDGKVSWTEKFSYGNMLNLSVHKNAEENVSKKFTILNGNLFQVVDSTNELIFDNKYQINENFEISSATNLTATTRVILKVDGYKNLSFDKSVVSDSTIFEVRVVSFSDLDSTSGTMSILNLAKTNFTIDSNCNYVLLTVYGNQENFLNITNNLYLGFTLSK